MSKSNIKMRGMIHAEAFDIDGNKIFESTTHNLVVNEGLDYILDVTLSSGTQHGTHYVGLKGTGAMAAGDTLSSHGNWSEVDAYDGSRKAWTEGGVSSQSIDNSGSPATFTIDTNDTEVVGAFLATSTDNSGTLVCGGDFSASATLPSGSTLNVTYTISSADDGA